MVTDSSWHRTSQAIQACMTCKTRKKKCNKALPSCGYCIRKNLKCVFARVRNHAPPAAETPRSALAWGSRPPLDGIRSDLIISTKSDPAAAGTHQGQGHQVYLEVHGIIRASGEFIDDISIRYFRGFHQHLPIISRIRFNNHITLSAAPTADFSILLLITCLITHIPALGYQPENDATGFVKQQSLYLTTKSLLAQIQASCPPSVPLIQSSLLLAMYEYTNARPDDAFVTFAGSARMAYALRLHHPTPETPADPNALLEAEEAANVWWGIVILERVFFSEVTISDQPLIASFPGGNARLPVESQVLDKLDILNLESIPNVPVSCLTSPEIEGFSRLAQAACLLDQVLKGFETPNIDSRLLHLDRIDTEIQAFLSLVMPQCRGQSGFCAAINIAIRTLFIIHWRILDQHSQDVRAVFKSLEEWHQKSQETLDTVTKMVVEIAESLIGPSGTSMIDGMPPTYPYIARAALRHIHSKTWGEFAGWLESEEVLTISLSRYNQRWGVRDEAT